MAKRWLLGSNYLQGLVEESKGFSKAPRYYHWVLGIFVYLFVHLFIFSVNKILLTTGNKNVL